MRTDYRPYKFLFRVEALLKGRWFNRYFAHDETEAARALTTVRHNSCAKAVRIVDRRSQQVVRHVDL